MNDRAGVSAVIVNWNTRELLRACLQSLANSLPPPDEIVVVDNASADGSAAMVADAFPEVTLIANPDNRRYAAANNQGIAHARGDLVWLLNPDTEVAADTLATLIRLLECDQQLAAVTCRLIDPVTRRVQPSVRTFPTPLALWIEALGLARLFPRSRLGGQYRMTWWDYDDEREVEQPMTSCLLLRRAAATPLGWFDEAFPLYFNDVDLCYRLRQAGWKIRFTPATEVIHHLGASTRQVRAEAVQASHRGLLRFYRKHYRGRLPELVYAATVALILFSGWVRGRLAQ